MTATTIAVTNTTTTSSTRFTAKQGICVYKELNRRINTIKQTTEKKIKNKRLGLANTTKK